MKSDQTSNKNTTDRITSDIGSNYLVNKIYYSLPYGIRRLLYARLMNNKYEQLQKKRCISTDIGHSFKPFDQNQCIFIHIPKTAGISICKSLFNNLAGGHLSIKTYQIAYSKEEFESYFKFTIVRNPWSRLFSAYNFLKKGGMSDKDKKWASKHLSEFTSFNDFVKKWLNISNIEKYIHFIPQYRFLCLPYSDDLKVDFVGFFENLHEDFIFITDRLSLGNSLTLKHENETTSDDKLRDYQQYYNDETREIVAKIYKKDIELFGYSFDNSTLTRQLANRLTN